MYAFDGTHSRTHTDIFIPEGIVPAFTAMALAFAAHAGLPQVEASMKDPKKFAYSFNFAYALVLLLYLPVAVIGYAVYGNGVYSPILCSLPQDNWVQQAAKALVTLHVLLTYPVLMTLLLGEVEKSIGLMPGEQGYLCKRSELRALFVAATVGVAAFVPYFDTMMSLVGAICVVMTTFVMPAVFYLKLRAKAWAQRLVPVLVALLGTVGGIVGAVQATIELWDKVSSGADPNSG
jgi:amino acid permease